MLLLEARKTSSLVRIVCAFVKVADLTKIRLAAVASIVLVLSRKGAGGP